MNKKVSIIIPVYNRGSLLTETLDSIRIQTYKNWECLVVDDGSNDNTLEILRSFTEKDSRFQVFKRPGSWRKGANSCRNYGFSKSKGSYIIWFDSDDLMTANHVEDKFFSLDSKDVDFVVSKTQNFRGQEKLDPYEYKNMDYGIKASDFILLKIHWYTYDVMLRRKIAEKIEWNEKMKSWQDYNYFCKMVLETTKGIYLDKILTYRRLHNSSIQASLLKSNQNFNKELLENRILTYQDISEKLDKHTKYELIYGMMNISFDLMKLRSWSPYLKNVNKIVKSELGRLSAAYFITALITARAFHGGYILLEKSKRRDNKT